LRFWTSDSKEKRSIVDEVTGLYGKGYFIELLGKACREYERSLVPFSLAILEVDRYTLPSGIYEHLLDSRNVDEALKVYNYILKQIASQLKSNIRQDDSLCRYGDFGSYEFAAIIRDIDEWDSAKLIEALREGVQNRFHTSPVKLTVSIGVAFPRCSSDVFGITCRAEIALGASLRMGGNRVSFFAPPISPGSPPTQPFGGYVYPPIRPPTMPRRHAKDPPSDIIEE
jgi:diguanylate cyclase (GGDEF)-like protein